MRKWQEVANSKIRKFENVRGKTCVARTSL